MNWSHRRSRGKRATLDPKDLESPASFIWQQTRFMSVSGTGNAGRLSAEVCNPAGPACRWNCLRDSGPEALAIFPRADECFHHFSFDKVAVEAMRFVQPICFTLQNKRAGCVYPVGVSGSSSLVPTISHPPFYVLAFQIIHHHQRRTIVFS